MRQAEWLEMARRIAQEAAAKCLAELREELGTKRAQAAARDLGAFAAIGEELLALDDDSLAALDELAEDDRLIRDVTGDAIRVEKIYGIEQRGPSVPPQRRTP
jgi:hypothetical protein